MGKSRRNRDRAHRSDPVGKPKPAPTDPELAKLRESKILPVLNDLKGSDPKQRTSAAGAIANIITDQKCRKLLLREQVVHTVLTETLTDSSLESRAAGWEILKVLALEEEADFCVHLYRVDVLSAAEHACNSVLEALKSSSPGFSKLPKAQQGFIWSIADAISILIGELGQAQEEVLKAVTANASIARFLFGITSHSSTTAEVLSSALACLMTLSEDNRAFCEMILNDQETFCYRNLKKLSESGGLKGALSCGVLHNLFSALEWHDHSPGLESACDAILVPLLSRQISSARLDVEDANWDVLQTTLEVLASIATNLQTTLEKGNKAEDEWQGIKDDDDQVMDLDDDVDDTVEDDDMNGDDHSDEEDDGAAGGDDDSEMDDEELMADMEKVTGADHEPEEPARLDDLPTLSNFLEAAVPSLIRITSSSPASEEALAIQGVALSVLNNLAWTVSSLDFSNGDNSTVRKVWYPVGCAIWEKTVVHVLSNDTADVELAALVTSLAWAISRTLGGKTPVHGDEHLKFISLYKAAKNMPEHAQAMEDPFQGLGVKCIGVLGQLARDPCPVGVNREIGIFLITIISAATEVPTADVVEALDQFYDIYGDESLACDNEVFWKDKFLEHLEGAVLKIKSMVKSIDKRKQSELRLRAEEAVTNMPRFIAYKKKHRPS
ncbi:hypothetical protein PspLS_08982 [Pyricularia sp. CBS 133598]|nr:hypothetical protein PspLS_08982 [Pyricularia sp. CBS 133598]